MSDFDGGVAPLQVRNEPAAGEPSSQQDDSSGDLNHVQTGDRTQEVGERIVAEHGDARGILAKDDSEPFRN